MSIPLHARENSVSRTGNPCSVGAQHATHDARAARGNRRHSSTQCEGDHVRALASPAAPSRCYLPVHVRSTDRDYEHPCDSPRVPSMLSGAPGSPSSVRWWPGMSTVSPEGNTTSRPLTIDVTSTPVDRRVLRGRAASSSGQDEGLGPSCAQVPPAAPVLFWHLSGPRGQLRRANPTEKPSSWPVTASADSATGGAGGHGDRSRPLDCAVCRCNWAGAGAMPTRADGEAVWPEDSPSRAARLRQRFSTR